MTILSWQQAKDLIVVTPEGKQIEHVKATDPDLGWVEVWATYEAHPDHKSIWVEDGKTVEKDIMLLSMTNMLGEHSYMTRMMYIDYDLVNWRTGEIIREVRSRKDNHED